MTYDNDLQREVAITMEDRSIIAAYPDGMNATEVLREIRIRIGNNAFPMASPIDVADELRELYGSPS